MSAPALRFCDPGKGDNEGRDWDREGLREGEDSKSRGSKMGRTWGQERWMGWSWVAEEKCGEKVCGLELGVHTGGEGGATALGPLV